MDACLATKWFVAALVITVGVMVLMTPMIRYVLVGWSAKRKDIMDGFNDSARSTYFEMFARSERQPSSSPREEFERIYTKWYGRKHFIVPGVLLLVVGIIIVSTIAFTGFHRFGYLENPFFDLPVTAMAALAGAYLWVVNDHTSRARRLDFSPADVHWATLRLLIAIPMGYAFAAVASASMGPFVAFALGAFPLSALTSGLRRIAEKNVTGLGSTADEAADDLAKLQGMNKAIVERLENEDVATVSQLAYCDPVRLVMRSNLTFNFVTDCMNQALAWLYLGESLRTLRPMGLRGAVEICAFVEEFDTAGTEGKVGTLATRALPKIAAAINQDPDTLLIALRQISQDPFTSFLSRMWSLTE